MLSQDMKEAVHDLRYLLNRDYPRDSAVEFVSDHYELELDKRHLLTRCVFSKEEVRSHRLKLVESSEIEGRIVGVDGYNVLITVESILSGDGVIRCDDGIVRDLQAIFGSYKMNELTEEAIKIILKLLDEMNPCEVFLFFDKQVSKSGELAGFTRRELKKQNLSGDAQTVEGVDKTVWEHEVSASSDRIIIERSERVLDIPMELLRKRKENYLDLTKI